MVILCPVVQQNETCKRNGKDGGMGRINGLQGGDERVLPVNSVLNAPHRQRLKTDQISRNPYQYSTVSILPGQRTNARNWLNLQGIHSSLAFYAKDSS